MGSLFGRLRLFVQVAFTALTNSYTTGFSEGGIYTGALKSVCVPGLNCYSCPGALGSCPIGSLQSVFGSRQFNFAFYVLGFLIMIGAIAGRFVCGWLCPFGLFQDLLYRIPFLRKFKKLPGDRWLKYLKYVMLIVFVILLPMLIVDIVGQGDPWFCKYVCPSGTLMAGIPLVLANESLRAAIGWLYAWKVAILIVVIILSIIVYRPFCRYICPLGAFYSLFNRFSLFRYHVDADKCTKCGKCQSACKIDIEAFKNPNSYECIRCGDCKRACPEGAINSGIKRSCEVKRNDG